MAGLESFIRDGAPWPPKIYGNRLAELAKYNALFECDHVTMYRWTRELRSLYFNANENQSAPAPLDEFVPYPAPEVAARTLSTFLFGEDAKIRSADGWKDEIAALVDDNHFHALNQEAATTCSVEGEIVYKVDWDPEVSKYAILSAVSGDRCFLVFRFRRLVECAIVREVYGAGSDSTSDDRVVFRHVEMRTRGRIVNRLYRGAVDALGASVDLSQSDDTADLEAELDTEIDDVLVRHVPFWRTARDPHGISIFRGKEGLIEAIHSLYSQDQHDAEMSKLRAAIPSSYLKRDDHGRPIFDRQLDILELSDEASGVIGGDARPLQPIQFNDTGTMGQRIAQRIDEFLLACGIAPQSAGRDVSGSAESGTARRLAQALTLMTVKTAGRYFAPALADLLELGVVAGAKHLDRSLPSGDAGVAVEIQTGMQDEPGELATQIANLASAQAISTVEKVKKLHPDWDQKLVDDEVERIHNDEGIKIPPPLGGIVNEPPANGG